MPEEEVTSSASSAGEATLSPTIQGPSRRKASFRPSAHFDPIVSSLGKAAEIVESLIIRQLREDAGPSSGQSTSPGVSALVGRPLPAAPVVTEAVPVPVLSAEDIVAAMSDPIVNNIESLVEGFKSGKSVDSVKDDVRKLITAQEERTELVHSLMVMHDLDRLPAYLRTRKIIESYLLRIAQRQDLTPAEGLAMLKIAKDEIEKITDHLRARASSVKDVDGLIQKADFAQHLSDEELAKKFAQTSTLGREIIRKVSFRILRAAQDHATS